MSRHTRAPRWLWRYLWAWAFGALVVLWGLLALVAYLTSVHEADEISDGQLVSVATLLLAQPPMGQSPLHAVLPSMNRRASETSVSYAPSLHAVVWEDGRVVWDAHGWAAHLPSDLAPGHHILAGQPSPGGVAWRIYVAEMPTELGASRKVVVGLDLVRRDWLGADIAQHIVRPALVLLPVLAWLLAWALRRGLRPLHDLSARIDELDIHATQLLVPGQPYHELDATVRALNQLLERLQTQIERERQFSGDLAHELRTPLTALVWQARLARDGDARERQQALAQLERDALRAGDILTQLLAWARAQQATTLPQQPLDLGALAQRVVAEHVAQAHQGGQLLGVALPAQPVWVSGHALMLELALRNLVDNALRHTGPGAEVEVGMGGSAAEGAQLWVCDSGRPEPSHDQPVAAGQGLGIGLTLVQRIAQSHGAELQHGHGEPPWRNRYALVWPAAAVLPVPSSP